MIRSNTARIKGEGIKMFVFKTNLKKQDSRKVIHTNWRRKGYIFVQGCWRKKSWISEEGNTGPDEFESSERVANIRCYSTELGNQLVKFLWCIWMMKEASHSIGIKWRGKRRNSAFWSLFCSDNQRRRNHVVSHMAMTGRGLSCLLTWDDQFLLFHC